MIDTPPVAWIHRSDRPTEGVAVTMPRPGLFVVHHEARSLSTERYATSFWQALEIACQDGLTEVVLL